MITNIPKSIFLYALSAMHYRSVQETATIAASKTVPMEFINQAAVQFEFTLPQGFRMGLNGRFERGIEIAKAGGVRPFQDTFQQNKRRLYQVNSSSFFKPPYLVDLDGKTCECPDHWKGHFCKHRVAASIFELADEGIPEERCNQGHGTPPTTLRKQAKLFLSQVNLQNRTAPHQPSHKCLLLRSCPSL